MHITPPLSHDTRPSQPNRLDEAAGVGDREAERRSSHWQEGLARQTATDSDRHAWVVTRTRERAWGLTEAHSPSVCASTTEKNMDMKWQSHGVPSWASLVLPHVSTHHTLCLTARRCRRPWRRTGACHVIIVTTPRHVAERVRSYGWVAHKYLLRHVV